MNHLTDETVIKSVLTQQAAPWKEKPEQAAGVVGDDLPLLLCRAANPCGGGGCRRALHTIAATLCVALKLSEGAAAASPFVG